MLPPVSAVRDRRKKLGWTQGELARRSGISQSAIAKIERGRMNPSYEVMRKLSEALEEGERNCEIEKVEHVMTRNVITISPRDTVKRAIDIMKEFGISQIPVIGNAGLEGMITESDILEAYEKFGRNAPDALVRQVVSAPPPVIRRDTKIDAVLALLKQYPAVLVFDNGMLVGIVTKVDLFGK